MEKTSNAWIQIRTAAAGPGATPTWKLSWDYDRFGNRKNQNVLAGSAPAPQLTINPSTNRVTDTGFSYDLGGNMTQDALNTYTYDAENRIKTVNGTAATYSYDGAGLRIKKVASGTTTVSIFSGTKVIAEYVNGAAVNAPTREYIYGGSQLLATVESGATKYHHPDHLSTRLLTDSTGAVVRTFGHYPFGEIWYETGTPDKWKFTSYERDPESLLDYAIFRYDASRLGRFMTPDPIAGSILDPQSLNRYSYVRNDPVNLTDPSGLDWFDSWLDLANHNSLWGPSFAAWIDQSQTMAWLDYAYWDLPGNWDPIAQEEYRHEWIIRTGFDPAFPNKHGLETRFKKCQAESGDWNISRNLTLQGYLAAVAASADAGINTAEVLTIWDLESSLSSTFGDIGLAGETGPMQITTTAQTELSANGLLPRNFHN